jgi:hypothetical protein
MEEHDFLALSTDQRKALQRQLQAQGYYAGPIDGKSGDGMRTALSAARAAEAGKAKAATDAAAQERADKLKEQEIANKRLEIETAAKTADAGNAEKTAAALRRTKYDEDAQSGLGLATTAAAGPGALMAGKILGYKVGEGINAKIDAGQTRRNEQLQKAAEDRVKGLTTREGAINATKLSGAMPQTTATLRALGRMAPHTGLGALALGTGAEFLSGGDPDQPFYPKMADRAFGVGNIGFGTGMLTQGIRQAASPGVSPDTGALAVINSNQLRRGNVAEEAAKLTPKQTLLAEAKAAGVTGTSRMNVTQLTEALRKIGKGGPLIAPLAAGTIAYGLTPDTAQAADGSNGEALTNAGLAATAAGGYGMLLKALGRVGNMAGPMSGPQMASDLTDIPQGDLNDIRNRLVRNLPSAMHVGALADAADMSQVPSPNPLRSQPEPGNAYYPLSESQMPQQAAPAGPAAPAQEAQPEQSALPSFASLDDLAAAAEQDPELAQMIAQLVQARLSDTQPQAQ